MRLGWGIGVGAGGALAGLVMVGAAAATPLKLSVETDVRLGYDMNPFLSAGRALMGEAGGAGSGIWKARLALR